MADNPQNRSTASTNDEGGKRKMLWCASAHVMCNTILFLTMSFLYLYHTHVNDPFIKLNTEWHVEIRFNQLLDEQDHNRCKDGNKAALLAEKLERLRALKDELAKDNWMFESKR